MKRKKMQKRVFYYFQFSSFFKSERARAGKETQLDSKRKPGKSRIIRKPGDRWFGADLVWLSWASQLQQSIGRGSRRYAVR